MVEIVNMEAAMAGKLISYKRLDEIVNDSLFRDSEMSTKSKPKNEADQILVDSMIVRFGFHRERLASHCDEVREMLSLLPAPFHHDRGGGWSALNLCNQEDGQQWTGFQTSTDLLVALGIGLGMVRFCIEDRTVWRALPGGMPYVEIKLDGFDVPEAPPMREPTLVGVATLAPGGESGIKVVCDESNNSQADIDAGVIHAEVTLPAPFRKRYMVATKAEHKLGDISRDDPDFCYVTEEDETHYTGNWAEGSGFFGVRFPKETTREATAAEVERIEAGHFVIGPFTDYTGPGLKPDEVSE
jgi:hypothetical protein